MLITIKINLESDEYRFLLTVLYAELKRLTDLRDHAIAHGDVAYNDSRIVTATKLIDALQYGQLDE